MATIVTLHAQTDRHVLQRTGLFYYCAIRRCNSLLGGSRLLYSTMAEGRKASGHEHIHPDSTGEFTILLVKLMRLAETSTYGTDGNDFVPRLHLADWS